MTVSSVIVTDLVPLRDRGFYQGMRDLVMACGRTSLIPVRDHDDDLWVWEYCWRPIIWLLDGSIWLAYQFLDPGEVVPSCC